MHRVMEKVVPGSLLFSFKPVPFYCCHIDLFRNFSKEITPHLGICNLKRGPQNHLGGGMPIAADGASS